MTAIFFYFFVKFPPQLYWWGNMNKLKLSIIILIATALNYTASAQNKASLTIQDGSLEGGSLEISDITDSYLNREQLQRVQLSADHDASDEALLNMTPAGRALSVADVAVDKIINIGTKIWRVVEAGRPISNFQQFKATALPQNVSRWDQLEQWQQPTLRVFSVSYKNKLNVETVRFAFRVVLLYGGRVQNVGRYIGYATVEPVEMTTAWGWRFDATAKANSVYNLGTRAAPVAGMLLNVGWTAQTVLFKSTRSYDFYIDGLGNIRSPATDRSINVRLQ